jgi:hypothetical protein
MGMSKGSAALNILRFLKILREELAAGANAGDFLIHGLIGKIPKEFLLKF